MAIVRKTMEEILKEITPEVLADMSLRLEKHIDEYDPDNPPMDDDELAELHEIVLHRRNTKNSEINSFNKITA